MVRVKTWEFWWCFNQTGLDCLGKWVSKNDWIWQNMGVVLLLQQTLWLHELSLRKLVSDCSEPPQLETFSSKGTSSMTISLNLASKRWACSTWSPPTSWQWILERGEGEKERTIASLSASHCLALLQNVSSTGAYSNSNSKTEIPKQDWQCKGEAPKGQHAWLFNHRSHHACGTQANREDSGHLIAGFAAKEHSIPGGHSRPQKQNPCQGHCALPGAQGCDHKKKAFVEPFTKHSLLQAVAFEQAPNCNPQDFIRLLQGLLCSTPVYKHIAEPSCFTFTLKGNWSSVEVAQIWPTICSQNFHTQTGLASADLQSFACNCFTNACRKHCSINMHSSCLRWPKLMRGCLVPSEPAVGLLGFF